MRQDELFLAYFYAQSRWIMLWIAQSKMGLNLERFNESVVHPHFKMESIMQQYNLSSYKGLLYGNFRLKRCILFYIYI
jgi:hypothetical protein